MQSRKIEKKKRRKIEQKRQKYLRLAFSEARIHFLPLKKKRRFQVDDVNQSPKRCTPI